MNGAVSRWRAAALVLAVSASLASAATSPGLRLIQAAKNGDAKAVRALIDQKADVTVTEADGSTALHWAAQRDSVEIAGLLIKAGAHAKAATRYGVTPLTLAATNGSAPMIDLLLKAGADPNGTSREGETVLMTAALSGRTDAIKVLLARGAQVNAVEPWKGQTPLMWAASQGNTAAAAMLIEFGADVKAKSKRGFTPLLFAVRNGHIDTTKLLLDHGANPDDVGPDGTSALGMATVNAYYELAGVLLDHGANPNAPDPRGSALHTIAWMRRPGSDPNAGAGGAPKGPPIPQGNLDSLDLARMLLKHGANPNVRIAWKEIKYNKDFGVVKSPPDIPIGRHNLSYVGATPFYVAAQGGDAPYMKVLAEGGADPKLTTASGITPLMAAAGLGYWDGESPGPFSGCPEPERLEAVKLALALGNDINAHSGNGDYAIEGDGKYLLLYYPSNLERLTENVMGDIRWSGSTALHGAVVSGQPTIAQYLIDHGAQVDARNRLGWTPLMVAEGVFVTNTKHEFPQVAEVLRKAMKERGLLKDETASSGQRDPSAAN